jgi:hypothetical protein
LPAPPNNATAPHALVSSSANGNNLIVEARSIGHAGNDITLTAAATVTDGVPHFSWSGSGRLSGGAVGTKASATLTIATGKNAGANDSVTIAGRKYTFRALQSQLTADGDVLIGPTAAATLKNLSAALRGAAQKTLRNLASAITRTATPDPNFYVPTTALLPVTADYIKDHTILITARSYLLDGNDITLSASPGSVFMIGGPFLEGGTRMKEITIHAHGVGGIFNGKPLKCIAGDDGPGLLDLPAAWTTEFTGGGADVQTAPDLILETTHTGIFAQGEHLYLNNLHIEGVTIGVNVVQTTSRSHVTIANVTCAHSNDSRQAYYLDPEGLDIPEPTLSRQAATHPPLITGYHPYYWNYSCAVLISRTPLETPGHQNGLDSVTIIGLSARDDCRYLIRDAAYNVDLTSWRQGRNVASGIVAFYARSNTSMPAAGVAPCAAYAGGYPYNTDAKVYFYGPVVLGSAVYEPIPLNGPAAGPTAGPI